MAFIDTYTFHARAGTGGDGVVRWRREKFVPNGGPAGGDGGRGGDFYVRAVRDINRLSKLARTDRHHAEDGVAGGSSSCTGRNGDRYTLELPIGSVVTLDGSDTVIELLHDGQEVLLLRGGEGGKGNEHFKSSTNQRPMQCTKGKKGEEGQYHVELRLMADVGFIGLPNAGKSSLLNAFTSAGARVADYPFTTLDPNLGTYHGFVFADIPGLIEGASIGKGLGHRFLKHVTRTKILVHCISLERDTLHDVYNTVRRELEAFGGLSDKPEYIVCTKSDLCTDEALTTRIQEFERLTGKKVLTSVSILDDASIKTLGDRLVDILHRGE